MAFKITPKNLGGTIGAIDGYYCMSSSDVVFACNTGRMFYTVNKTLVPEWPTFTDVYSFTVTYNAMLSFGANVIIWDKMLSCAWS